MMKRIAASLILVIAVGCASAPMNSSAAGGAGATVPGISTSVKNAPDYVLLTAPGQVRSWDFSNAVGVRGFHIRGTMTSRGFVPAGEVLGNGKFCADGKEWLSLADLTVHKASEAPVAPYVMGCASVSGFQPASRTIVAQ